MPSRFGLMCGVASVLALGSFATTPAQAHDEVEQQAPPQAGSVRGGAPPASAPEPARAPITIERSASHDVPVPPPTKTFPVRKVVFVPRVAVPLGGSGDDDHGCSSTGPASQNGYSCANLGTQSIDDKTGFTFGADVLFHLAPNVRLGVTTLYATETKYQFRGASLKLGSDLTAAAVLEGVLPLSSSFALSARAMGGANFLFTGGDYTTALQAERSECPNGTLVAPGSIGTTRCSIDESRHTTLTWGVGAGALVNIGPANLRIDFLYQALRLASWSSSVTEQNGHAVSTSETLLVSRLLLLFGVEVGD